MKRAIAIILALVGGGLAGFAAAASLAVTATGVLWLFVYGDDSWPAWTGPVLDNAVVVVGLVTTAIVAWVLYKMLTKGFGSNG